ncbi:MAG TPA: (Fe-S)-binding protein [Candidatus Hydrogenedentes bacterium]|nr:(Fe-S)-binding protein [Candidatus Hydrogenedentota bacterium]
MSHVLLAGVLMAGLGGLLALSLAIASRWLYVFEDPRIDVVEGMLPGANCGACGSAGCRAFAEATIAGAATPAKCSVSSREGVEAIASYLGIAAGSEERRVARLACAGGSNVAWMRARYQGMKSCRGAALVSGGGKGCAWGCLGLGDCERVCDFNAITMNEHGLPVVNESKCTACGDCVEICPKDLFSIHPVSHRLWVACKSLQAGEEAEAECEVACTGCGRCEADAAPGLIKMVSNLAVVNYSKSALATREPIRRCPTGAIVWLDEILGPVKGEEARHISRKSPLPLRSGPTSG